MQPKRARAEPFTATALDGRGVRMSCASVWRAACLEEFTFSCTASHRNSRRSATDDEHDEDARKTSSIRQSVDKVSNASRGSNATRGSTVEGFFKAKTIQPRTLRFGWIINDEQKKKT